MYELPKLIRSSGLYTSNFAKGNSAFAGARAGLKDRLSDSSTVAWYQPGAGVTGTLTASAWANQLGAAGNLAQGTDAARLIYLPFTETKYGYIPNVNGNNFTTPDSVPTSITGSIDIRVRVAMDDWTPAVNSVLLSKTIYATNQASYVFYVSSAGALVLEISPDGTSVATATATSSVVTGVTDGAVKWVRVTWNATTKDVIFYLSDNGTTWSALGTTQTANIASIFDSTTAVTVGTHTNGTAPMLGKIYCAQIYSGIAGTLAAEFNASDWIETFTNGATQVSGTTGETWTLNNTAIATPAAFIGSSFLVANESNRWMRATYTANQPRTIYIVGMDPVWAAGKYIADGVTANTLGLSKTTGTPKISLNAGAAACEDANLTLRAKGIITIVLNGASSSVQVNLNTATTGNPGAGNPGGITIGADGGTPTAGTYGGFWYSEIIDRDGSDSAATKLAIQQRLSQIHGITI